MAIRSCHVLVPAHALLHISSWSLIRTIYTAVRTSPSARASVCDCAVLMCAQARLFVSTGTPIAPHSFDGLDGMNVNARWVRVPAELLEVAGLDSDSNTVTGFCRRFDCLRVPQKDWVHTMSIVAVHP